MLKFKLLLSLFLLAIVDAVIPLPIVSAILIYVIIKKPPWFIKTTLAVYGLADVTDNQTTPGQADNCKS
jgi:hypothetical protein